MDEKNLIVKSNRKLVLPEGATIHRHLKVKTFRWHRKTVLLYQTEEQKKGLYVREQKIVNSLMRRKKTLLNLAVLQFLLANKRLIPQSWEGKTVSFAGTVLKYKGKLFTPYLVRYQLRGRGGHWRCKFSEYSVVSLGALDTVAVLAE